MMDETSSKSKNNAFSYVMPSGRPPVVFHLLMRYNSSTISYYWHKWSLAYAVNNIAFSSILSNKCAYSPEISAFKEAVVENENDIENNVKHCLLEGPTRRA